MAWPAHQLPFTERVALSRAVMPDVWPGWTLTTGSDRPSDVIRVVDSVPSGSSAGGGGSGRRWGSGGRAGSTWEREHLLFRDHLRVHRDAREAYSRAKREAAAGGPTTGSPTPTPRPR